MSDADGGEVSTELIVLAGSAAIWATTASSGSIAKPRTAVTAPAEEEAAEVNAEGVLIPDAGAEKVERKRNMAEGLSLDNLISFAINGRRGRMRALTFQESVNLCRARGNGLCIRTPLGRGLHLISVTGSLRGIKHTCAQQEHADMIGLLRGWDLKERVGVIDLLEIGLEEAAGNTAPEHYDGDAGRWWMD